MKTNISVVALIASLVALLPAASAQGPLDDLPVPTPCPPPPGSDIVTETMCTSMEIVDEYQDDIDEVWDTVTGLPVVDTTLWVVDCVVGVKFPSCGTPPILEK